MKHVLTDDGETYFIAKTKKDSEFVDFKIGSGSVDIKVLLTKDECLELAHNLFVMVGEKYD